ncbi:hypothetical protein SLS60_003374 [Paraconiothyrium brasiliense]|uniref:C2H2-type domain-containing protein n=1 Tax=Paraconiothyrium brasiliense TaxID=300254 RepID=A0ABR3RVI0_9PLEO
MDNNFSAAARSVQALPAESSTTHNGRKRQKRAALTTITPAELAGNQHRLSATASPSSNGETYDHLLHWDREEGDAIVEWDKEGWSEANDETDDEEERAAVVYAVEEGEIESISGGSGHNSLDAEEMAIRQVYQQSRERAGKVPKEVVIRIINESIEAFTNDWSPSKIMELESKDQPLDPIRLWEDGEALNCRTELIERYTFEVRLFENKLDRLAEEICKIPQNSEKQVRQHCRNLEMHVHNLETAKWYLSIYELPPVDTEDGNDHEQHATQTSARGHDAEVIDLGSSPESSEHGDEKDLLVDAEEPAVTHSSLQQAVLSKRTEPFERKEHLKQHLTIHSDTRSHKCTECGYETKRKDKLHNHLEHHHDRDRAAAGRTTNAAGTEATAYPENNIEMVLDNPPTVATDVTAPRTLGLVRLRSTILESAVVSSIEPDKASNSPTTRHAESRSRKSQKARGSRPEIASILTVSGWDMQDLVAAKDRKRIVMKVMLEMSRQERDMIHKRITALKKSNLLKEISTCIDMLYRKEQKMLGVLPSDLPKIKAITNFFLCWWLADDYMQKVPSDQQLHELVTELHQCDDLSTFYDWVYFILNRTFSEEAFRSAQAPSQDEIIVISDDDELKSARPPSRKQTPRRVQAQYIPQDNIIRLH